MTASPATQPMTFKISSEPLDMPCSNSRIGVIRTFTLCCESTKPWMIRSRCPAAEMIVTSSHQLEYDQGKKSGAYRNCLVMRIVIFAEAMPGEKQDYPQFGSRQNIIFEWRFVRQEACYVRYSWIFFIDKTFDPPWRLIFIDGVQTLCFIWAIESSASRNILWYYKCGKMDNHYYSQLFSPPFFLEQSWVFRMLVPAKPSLNDFEDSNSMPAKIVPWTERHYGYGSSTVIPRPSLLHELAYMIY